jgi:uncharacterized protein (DUF1501 family)
MNFTRRQFLKSSLAASALGAVPDFWARAAQALQPCETGVNFIIVQLEGGNDGINMLIPMSNGSGLNRTTYTNVRPYIGIPPAELAATQVGNDPLTTGQLALHPHMVGLKALYDSGNLAVVAGVHYADKDLSHENSEQIWYRADPTLGLGTTGWMGRTLDQLCSGQPSAVPAVDTQDELTPLFYGNTAVLSFASLAALNFPLTGDIKTRFTAITNTAQSVGANFVKPVAAAAYAAVTKIDSYKMAVENVTSNLNDIRNGTNNAGTFGVVGAPQRSSLTTGLRTVNALMRGGPPGTPLGCRVFRVRIGGFDSHSQQGFHIPLSTKSITDKVLSDQGGQNTFNNQEYHGRLMHRLSSCLAAFWQDLKNVNLHKNTVIMTFSEFGRSVVENGDHDSDSGTDHSTAAPMFVIGPTQAESNVGHWINGGQVYGAYQNLAVMDNGQPPTGSGDPVPQLDFRHVYGEIINRWFGQSVSATNTILGGGFSYNPQGFLT